MAQYDEMDHDKTSIVLDSNIQNKEEKLPFTPVAVAPGRQAPPSAPYLAQQTSIDEYTPGLNPLVKAAANILLEIVRLRNARDVNMESLRTRLEAEIRGFSSQAMALGVSEAQVNAAQYLLCTALDESVTTSSIAGAQAEWQNKSLLSTFHKDTWGGEVFFDVLSRTMEQPASRLYLLELIYLLLSLGFEGKYRLEDRGALAVESLRDQLYRQIRLLRGEATPDLAKKVDLSTFKDKVYAYIPAWLIGAVVVFCLSITWWGFSYTLKDKSRPLLAQYESQAPTKAPFILSEAGAEDEDAEEEQVEADSEKEEDAAQPASDSAKSSPEPTPAQEARP